MCRSLSDLPLEDVFFHYLADPKSLQCFESTSTAAREISRRDDARAWCAVVGRRWGPVNIPSKSSCNWKASREWQQPPADWRELAIYLETVVLQSLMKSVKKAIELLVEQHILIGSNKLPESAWHATVHRLLEWVPLHEKRRLTAFVCADWQPAATLPIFLAPLPICGATPEHALRDLLLRFPFLPIDAGQGADRVIGTFSRAYVLQSPQALAALGLFHGSGEVESGIQSSSSDEEESGEETDTETRMSQAWWPAHATPPRMSQAWWDAHATPSHRAARDAVYTLTYSIIMLNTDLNNPAIHPKITCDEYTASCHRCVPLRSMDDETLRVIYSRVAAQPLQIYYGQPGVTTAVHASQSGDDTETGATYSQYSVLRGVGGGGGGGGGSGGGGGGIVIGGGTPHSHAAATAHSQVKIDWVVAYWNLVDMGRYARAASWRWVGAQTERAAAWLPAGIRRALEMHGALVLRTVALPMVLASVMYGVLLLVGVRLRA